MGRFNKKSKQRGKRRNAAGPSNSGNERCGAPQAQTDSTTSSSNRGGDDTKERNIYVRYKEATRSFRDGLSKLLPPSLPLVSVDDLGNAVEYCLCQSEKGSRIPPVGTTLLSCLNESITLREGFSVLVNVADSGHAYMNRMLRYCQEVLRKCRKIYVASTAFGPSSKKISTSHHGSSSLPPLGKFEALTVSEEGEDDADDSVNQKESAVPATTRPPEPDRSYSIERDLIEGGDRFQAQMYAFQIGKMFDMIDHHFDGLKSKITKAKSMAEHSDGDSIVEDKDTLLGIAVASATMRTTAMVNLVLEELKYLDEALVAESPHFKTFYHIVAILVFPAMIRQLEDEVPPKVLKSSPHIVLDYIATEVEWGFRTLADPKYFSSAKPRRNQFLKKAKVTSHGEDLTDAFYRMIHSLTILEVAPEYVKKEKRFQQYITACQEGRRLHCMALGIDPSDVHKMWSVFTKSSTGTRSILHTQSLLQSNVHSIIPGWRDYIVNLDRTLSPDAIGPTWNETNKKAKDTTDSCMVDFFMRVFYQVWINKAACTKPKNFDTFFGGLLPQFCPLIQGLLNHLKRGNTSVSFSFTLSVHAMLTGILILQGNGDVGRIASTSRDVSKRYYNQLQWILDRDVKLLDESLLRQLKSYDYISSPSIIERATEERKLLAFWNPLMAGSFLLQISYLSSLSYGPLIMNGHSQTATVMHLLHALRARNIFERDRAPYLLYITNDFLQGSNAIWGEGKPVVDFCKNYFLACGVPLSASTMVAKFVKSSPWNLMENASEEQKAQYEKNIKGQFMLEKDFHVCRLALISSMIGVFKRGTRQNVRLVKAEDISTSFRAIVKQDYSKLPIDKDFLQGNDVCAFSLSGMCTSMGSYFHRQKALDQMMGDESLLLSLNLPKAAWHFADFLLALSSHMGWDDLVSKCCNGTFAGWKCSDETKKIYVIRLLIADRIFGELDSDLDNPDEYKESKQCAKFLDTYFSSIGIEDITFWGA